MNQGISPPTSDGDKVSDSDLLEIDRICDAFESTLRAGEPPSLARSLRSGSQGIQDRLLVELASIAIQFLKDSGDNMPVGTLLRHNPSHTSALNRFAIEFGSEQQTAQVDSGAVSTTQPTVQCPRCHETFDIRIDSDADGLICDVCGHHFRLGNEAIETSANESAITLGRFRLVELAGQGRFGRVYKAFDTRLAITVAIKIPRRSSEYFEMFQDEARALAQLKHEGIVRVHDIGHAAGMSFIVSDFVRGVTLGEWCHDLKPNFRQAARWCQQLALALEHAHERQIVHLDLKPANIMLTRVSNDSNETEQRTVITDFGLARHFSNHKHADVPGDLKQSVGTPAYMSPEQARGQSELFNQRSDVYSLGVVLYELLTGQLPFAGGRNAVMDSILHDEPPDPRIGNKKIPKDLATIALKCMKKEQSQRYQSASETAADLQRWLEDKPILARPAGPLEKSVRWLRRNKLISILSFSLLTSMIAGTVFSALFAIEAREQANLASVRATAAEDAYQQEQRVLRILRGAFKSPPDRSASGISHVLESAESQITEELRNQPAAESSLLASLGEAWLGMHEPARAVHNLTRARRLMIQHYGEDHPETLRTGFLLADAYSKDRFSMGEAITLHNSVLVRRRKVLGNGHRDTIMSLSAMAAAYVADGRIEKGLLLHKEALQLARSTHSESSPITVACATNMGVALIANQRFAEAEDFLEEAVALANANFGRAHPHTLTTKFNLAQACIGNGKSREAFDILVQVHRERARIYGKNDKLTLKTIYLVVETGLSCDRLEETERLISQYVGNLPADLSPTTMRKILYTYFQVAKADRALPIAMLYLRRMRDLRGPDHADTLDAMTSLGAIYSKLEMLPKAVEMLSSSLAGHEKVDAPDRDLLTTAGNLARVHRKLGNYDQAIRLFERTLAGRTELLSRSHRDTQSIVQQLAALLVDAGRYQDAITYYEEAISELTKDEQTSLRALHMMGAAGLCYLRTAQLDRGRALFAEAAEGFASHIEQDPENVSYHYWRTLCELAAGRTNKYRDSCAEMQNRFGDFESRDVAFRLCLTYLLSANSAIPETVLATLAEKSKNPTSRRTQLIELGRLYRNGLLVEAVAYYDIEVTNGRKMLPWDRTFYAMSLAKLGRTTEALEELAAVKSFPTSTLDWTKQTVLQLLTDEAHSLVR